MTAAALPIIINKQPILNHKHDVTAFHLSIEAISDTELSLDDWRAAIDSLYQELEEQGGFSSITNNKPTYYSAPIEVLQEDLLPSIDKTKLFIEVTEAQLAKKASLEQLRELIVQGYKLVLRDYSGEASQKKFLSLAKAVKLPVTDLELDQINAITQDLPDDVDVILTEVDTEQLYSMLSDAGYKLFQGFYFTEPVLVSSQEAESGSLAMMQLLAELSDPNVEFNRIVDLVQTDVTMSHKLLTAINHPSNDLPYVIESLKDAVSFMGLKRLKFWINIMALSEVKDVPKELLVTALIRAKFMESIADQTGHQADKDRFFVVGLFSTLNAFIKIPMADIVDKLPLGDESKLALTTQQGSMGKVLFIVKALEQGNTQMFAVGHEGLGVMQISSSYVKSSGWAHRTMASF